MKKDKMQKAVSETFGQNKNRFSPLIDCLFDCACTIITKEDVKNIDLSRLKQLIQIVKELRDLSHAEDAAADVGKLESLIRGWIGS